MRAKPQDLSGWTWTDNMGSVVFPAGMSLWFSQILPPLTLVILFIVACVVGFQVWHKVPGQYTPVAGLATVFALVSFLPRISTDSWGSITLSGGNYLHRLVVLQIGIQSSTP